MLDYLANFFEVLVDVKVETEKIILLERSDSCTRLRCRGRSIHLGRNVLQEAIDRWDIRPQCFVERAHESLLAPLVDAIGQVLDTLGNKKQTTTAGIARRHVFDQAERVGRDNRRAEETKENKPSNRGQVRLWEPFFDNLQKKKKKKIFFYFFPIFLFFFYQSRVVADLTQGKGHVGVRVDDAIQE